MLLHVRVLALSAILSLHHEAARVRKRHPVVLKPTRLHAKQLLRCLLTCTAGTPQDEREA